MNGGRTWLFYIGIGAAIIGLLMLLASQAPLGFYVGTMVTCIGLILFGMGLRSRLKEKNATLGNVVLIVALAAAVVLAYLAYFTG
jgi:hypothetical protein